MSVIASLNKNELKLVAEELGLTVPEDAKFIQLKELIEKSDQFADTELVKGVVKYVIDENKLSKEAEKSKLELEKIKLEQLQREIELENIRKETSQNSEIEKIKLAQIEKQLEIANIQKESHQTSSSTAVKSDNEGLNNNLENLLKSVKTLTIAVPSRVESFNLFFQSLERAFKTKHVPDEYKSEILLNILGERVNNLMIYMSDEDLSDYDKLKAIVLREFQPTPQECLNNFRRAQKLPSENYVQFASRLSAMFEYYCQIRKVDNFKSLCELLISDKMFSSLDRDLMSHISVKQGESYFTPTMLGKECDIFMASKGKNKIENLFTVSDNKPFVRNRQNSRYQKGNVLFSEIKNIKCILCKNNENHTLNMCPKFKTCSVSERVEILKRHRLCFKCFLPNCNVKKCHARNCFCGKPHNKMICFSRGDKNENTNIKCSDSRVEGKNNGDSFPPVEFNTQAVIATSCMKNKTKNVLLSTARILVRDKNNQFQEKRVLLDVGSEICLVTRECANQLQLKINKMNCLLSCVDNTTSLVKGCVRTTIANKNKSFERDIDFMIVEKITDLIPHSVLNVEVEISASVPLADYSFNIPGKIDMLLGAEIFYELLKPGQIYAQNSQLLLQNSVFGYIASTTSHMGNESAIHCGLVRGEDLNKTLSKFWETEEIEIKLPKTKENEICEEHFMRTHWRDENGKYVVFIPFKDNPACLGDTREIALRKLRSLWARMSKNQEYLMHYKTFINEYKNLGHMREVIEDKVPDVVYYATHHGIFNPEKTSSKMRVVFNCSSPSSNGISLNSLQYNGGVIQRDLYSIMLEFRKYIYAFTGDIQKMYRMIKIDPSQYSLQRILWCKNENETPKTYELMTVTYGTVSAPFLAMRTLEQLSIDEGKDFPKTVSVLRENFYMDDVLCGAETLDEAKDLKQQLIGILKRAGMSLHKMCANNIELSSGPEEEYKFKSALETKTLGVSWRHKEDCFTFNVEISLQDSYTKRAVLSTIARLFDPLGLLGPIIAKAKVFMQKLWRLDIDWNDMLPEAEYREWHQFMIALNAINNINIKRCILIEKAKIIELHGFADASERCFGAVVYCKSTNYAGETVVRLITSKSRVSPVKSLTVPRLELAAAVLLTKLVHKVMTATKLPVNQLYLWTDSSIVLSWIQKEPADLKRFVQNRVATIQELSSIDQWHHVSSDKNPADVLSRGMDPDKLLHYKMWWTGPEFLMDSEYPNDKLTVPENSVDFHNELKETSFKNSEKLYFLNINITSFVNDVLNLSNNYVTILRILSFIFRFLNNVKDPRRKRSGPLTTDEIRQSEIFLIKEVQKENFSSEIRVLKSKGMVSPTSKLKTLNPCLDSEGLIRVGGRLSNANVSFFKKHPIVLPKSHKITYLIVSYYHKKFLHIGICNLLNHIREKYWPLNARTVCKKIVHECLACYKNKPIVVNQLMGDLPKERVTLDYPFNCSGVDLCGPFVIKLDKRRKSVCQKVYVCLFICFVFKAIHIEIVSDLTAESFVAALKRFVARRGKCAKLFSDNATNFVGASKEIKKFQEIIQNPPENLANYLSTEGIEWKFIPPRAPNFGGLWEAAIKAFKYHFKRVVGGTKLTYEEFLTVSIQIEGVLNARPLSPLSNDEQDFGVLTPAHFLINRSLNSIIEPDLSNLRENQLSKWQRVTRIVQTIWRKWHRNYLSELQQRNKWRFEKDNVKIGDLVLIVEENLPTNKWPLGRITEVIQGNDKKIRVVIIKTQNGTIKRSISKICLLPMAKE